jgi:hypothetical protein
LAVHAQVVGAVVVVARRDLHIESLLDRIDHAHAVAHGQEAVVGILINWRRGSSLWVVLHRAGVCVAFLGLAITGVATLICVVALDA